MVNMTRQNYYKCRRYRRRIQIDESFIISVVRRERAVQPRLGSRKLLHILRSEFEHGGVSIGRDRFFRLLSRNGLLIKRRSKGCRTTNSRHFFGVYENLVKDFCLRGPCQVVVSDITYIRTDEGFMYLSLIMDAYSRAILGYDCSDSLEAEGALRSLSMASKHLKGISGVIHHSDRGIQYCCSAYVKRLKRGRFRISMTEVNHCYENGKAERLNGILKQEYGLGDSFLSKSDARRAVNEAVKLYNYRRPHQELGYRCPMEVQMAA
jgi:transposase InsO family protein